MIKISKYSLLIITLCLSLGQAFADTLVLKVTEIEQRTVVRQTQVSVNTQPAPTIAGFNKEISQIIAAFPHKDNEARGAYTYLESSLEQYQRELQRSVSFGKLYDRIVDERLADGWKTESENAGRIMIATIAKYIPLGVNVDELKPACLDLFPSQKSRDACLKILTETLSTQADAVPARGYF
jgi:hypothetical protein